MTNKDSDSDSDSSDEAMYLLKDIILQLFRGPVLY